MFPMGATDMNMVAGVFAAEAVALSQLEPQFDVVTVGALIGRSEPVLEIEKYCAAGGCDTVVW